jgi:uncharacterized membrane protein
MLSHPTAVRNGSTRDHPGESPESLSARGRNVGDLCATLSSADAATGSRQEEVREHVEEIGPVDYMIIAFPGNDFQGEIAPALGNLVESGTIRIMDVAFVLKDEDGNIATMEITDLDPQVAAGLENAGFDTSGLFNEEDLEAAAEELEPNSSAALLVWENVWAREVAQAMRNAGGVVLDFDRLPHEVVQAAREWAAANA